MKPYTLIAWSLGLLLLVSGCSRNPVTGKREVMFMSESQEIALGKKSDPSIVAAYGLYQDDKLQAFITEKGKAMAAISHRPNLPYEFKILDSPVVNAFALPGGYVYFTRGIMAHFNNEAEFAGVLGHETGHITARHSAKQSRNQMLGNIAFIGGVLVSEDFRRYAQQAQQGLGLLFKKFSRDHERESDKLGVHYSSEIGYDAVQMAEFFKTLSRLSEKRGQSIPTFMSTHPDPGNRYHDVQQHAHEHQSKNPGKKYKINRNEYLRRIDGIVYGDDPKQGFFENNHFYHPDLKFEFRVPMQWQTKNTPSNVQMAPQDGKSLITFSLAKGQSAQEAANTFASANKLQVLQSAQENVNGLNGYAFIATQPQQNQQTGQTNNLKLLCYFIEYNDLIYLFSGVSQEVSFDNYFNTFRDVMVSFKPLSDPDKLNRKPMVVKIVTAQQSAPLSTQLQSFGMSSSLMTDLSILNGMELTDVVEKGTLFKIVKMSDGSRVPSTPTYPSPNGGTQPKANVPTTPKPKVNTNLPKPNKPKTDGKKGKSTTKGKVIKLKKIEK